MTLIAILKKTRILETVRLGFNVFLKNSISPVISTTHGATVSPSPRLRRPWECILKEDEEGERKATMENDE